MRHYDDHDSGVEWATPNWITDPLIAAIGGFDLDPASGCETYPLADTTYTIEDDGLSTDWFGDVWVNPPYGRTHNPKWADRVSDQFDRQEVNTITALVPASTDTQWFQNNYAEADYLTFIEGRVSFTGGENSATFASVIASFGDFSPKYIDALAGLGSVFRKGNCR